MIERAIQGGRLELSYDPKRGIRQDVADREWEANSKPAVNGNGDGDEGIAESQGRARTRLARAKAELAEMEVRKKRGELVEAREVREALAGRFATIRDRLSAIPDRVSAEIAGVRSVRKIRARLREEITSALASLSEEAGGREDGKE